MTEDYTISSSAALLLDGRIVVKRTWRRLWWRKRRVRQELRRITTDPDVHGGWDWVDVEVLPDLPEAVVRE